MAALRNNSYKYIYFYNDDTEIVFDLKKNPNETINCIQTVDKRVLEVFRKSIKDYENELYSFHKKDLDENIIKLAKNIIDLNPMLSQL